MDSITQSERMLLLLLLKFRWVDQRHHLPCCHLKPVISNYATDEMVEQVLTRGRMLGFHFLNNVFPLARCALNT
jgi:putative component of membrane protein insertase Oxa1/YidC/SpoIIIJ protein YidD